MISALEATVTGRVQGVMFRDFTRRKARGLELVGKVVNRKDGSVKVYTEGEEENLRKFVEALKKGPMFARVDNVVHVFTSPLGGYDDFNIVYE